MIVSEPANLGEEEGPELKLAVNKSGSAGYRRYQKAAGRTAELRAFGIQKIQGHRVDARHVKNRFQISRSAVRRQDRDAGINESAERAARTLASTLIVDVEKAPFLVVGIYLPSGVTAEYILLYDRARLAALLQKPIVGVENRVAEILPGVEVIACSAALEDGIDVAAAIAPLGGVVEAGTDLEFFDRVRIGERRVS